MKKNQKIKRLVILLVLGIFLSSCSQGDGNESTLLKDNSNLILEEVALDISKNINQIHLSKQIDYGKSVLQARKSIKEFKSVKDENNKNLFYITNYKEGGFVILSADNRVSPILAYSENSEFRTNADEYSTGLIEWLSKTKEGIQLTRKNKALQTEKVKNEWENITTYKIDDPSDPDDCENEYEQVGPLLSTEWHQRCGFNDFMPTINCSSLPCGKAYAGCVPIAIAQVMKYHNSPSNYNWENMPNTYGTTTTASLINDIHNSISEVSYDCDGTGVDKNYNTAGVFTNHFNYSSANQSSYNKETVKQQLRWNRPVILGGGRKSGWWIFSSYKGGHMWVCDGFRRIFSWDEDCSTGWSSLFFHMNWGWGGDENGWYSFNNFNPDNHTFNYQVKMTYNIKP